MQKWRGILNRGDTWIAPYCGKITNIQMASQAVLQSQQTQRVRARMSKRRKRLERMRENPNAVSLEDLRRILEDYGFEYRRTVGSHYTFNYTLSGQTRLFVVPFRRPVKPVYVKRAIKLIDAIVEEMGEYEPDESGE
jgi:predicted RNA binding protein YcfA (HicA-like mRNA interferase family)